MTHDPAAWVVGCAGCAQRKEVEKARVTGGWVGMCL